MANVYIKPMTWAGKLTFYVGYQPSDPTADYCMRLGGFFIAESRLSAARAIAAAEAVRIGGEVIECPHYVGLEIS